MKSYSCLGENCIRSGEYAVVPVQPEHIESIRLWRNAQLDVLRQTKLISPEQQVAYYATAIWPSMSESNPSNILLSFLYRGQPIGYGGLVHISWQDLNAEVSFLMDPIRAAFLQEYASEFRCFLNLIKCIAFDRLGLERLYTETYNTRSFHISVLEESGFLREGVMRNHVNISGSFVDSIIHGCLKSYGR